MADFNLKYDFAPHLENPGETEEIDWNTLEEMFISDSELACLDVCYEIPVSTSTEEAAPELNNAFEIEKKENFSAPIFPNSKKRFKNVTDMELKQLEDKKHSISTKRSTKWGVKLFQGM